MALTHAEVKLYCKVDNAEDDMLIEGLIEAAEALLLEQCGKTTFVGNDGTANEPIEDTALFQTAQKQLIAHWFDNRTAASSGASKDMPFSVDMLIAHFKYSKEYV